MKSLIAATILIFAMPAFAADITVRDVNSFLSNWLAAQNTGSYTSYSVMYAQEFFGIKRSGKQTSSFNRNTWLQDRKQLFKKKMRVSAGNVQIKTLGTTATVKFEQTWESHGYKDKGEKQLYLVIEKNGLKIKREEMLYSNVSRKPLVSFRSAYTDLKKDCKDKFYDNDDDGDMPVICKGPGGYIVDVEFSACCEHMQVQGGRDFLF